MQTLIDWQRTTKPKPQLIHISDWSIDSIHPPSSYIFAKNSVSHVQSTTKLSKSWPPVNKFIIFCFRAMLLNLEQTNRTYVLNIETRICNVKVVCKAQFFFQCYFLSRLRVQETACPRAFFFFEPYILHAHHHIRLYFSHSFLWSSSSTRTFCSLRWLTCDADGVSERVPILSVRILVES